MNKSLSDIVVIQLGFLLESKSMRFVFIWSSRYKAQICVLQECIPIIFYLYFMANTLALPDVYYFLSVDEQKLKFLEK